MGRKRAGQPGYIEKVNARGHRYWAKDPNYNAKKIDDNDFHTPEDCGRNLHCVTNVPNYGGFYNDTTPKAHPFKDSILIEFVHHIDLDTMKVTTTPN